MIDAPHGYLAFFRGTSLVSRVIKWRTWGPYSHAAWICEDGTIYESWHMKDRKTGHTGPRKGIAGDLHKKGTVVDLFAVALSPDARNALVSELEAPIKRGIRYDFRGIIGGFILRKPQSEVDNVMFCSDYIMDAFNRIGVPLLCQVPTWKISPSELVRSPLLKRAGLWRVGEPWPTVFMAVNS